MVWRLSSLVWDNWVMGHGCGHNRSGIHVSRGEAEIVRELLLSNGIEAFVVSDDCGAVDPALSFARGVQLLVAENDVEQAERIIAEATANKSKSEEEEE
jgi:hypothetical protein